MRPDWEDGDPAGRRLRADPAERRPRPDRAARLEPRRLPRAARRQRRAAARRLHRRPGPAGGDDAEACSRFAGSSSPRRPPGTLEAALEQADRGEPAACAGRWSSAACGCTGSTEPRRVSSPAAIAMTLEGRDRPNPLPDAADDGRERSALPGRRGAPRRAHLPEDLLRFTAAEGAGGHCEMRTARSPTGASSTGSTRPSGLDARAGRGYQAASRFPGGARAPARLTERRTRPMARRCELTGKSPMVGNNVSHANNKTKRRFLPNLNEVSLTSEALGQTHRFRISASALRTRRPPRRARRLPRQGARRRAVDEGAEAQARDREVAGRRLTAIRARTPRTRS